MPFRFALTAVVLAATAAHALEYQLVRTVPIDRGRALATGGPGQVLVTFEGAAWLLKIPTGEFVQAFTLPAAVDAPLDLTAAAMVASRALVGAPRREQLGVTGGGVYIYGTIPGVEPRTITRPSPHPWDSFGYTMAVAGQNVLIGSPGNLAPQEPGDLVAGAVYLVEPTTGDILRTITAPTPRPGDTFGSALWVDGERVLIAAPDSPVGEPVGLVYDFDWASGDLLGVYSNTAPAPDTSRGVTLGFGASATRTEAFVVVGVPFDGEGKRGEVRAFDRPGFTPSLVLASPSHASFGSTVFGVPGGLLIAAPFHGDGGAGSVFVLNPDGAIVQTLHGFRAGFEEDMFGSRIARDGKYLLVLDSEDSGAVYVFAETTSCGNGLVEEAEVCDDGNTLDGDGCDRNCRPTLCGNALRTEGEECDDGNAENGDGCDENCTFSRCGNGIVGGGEECDDANADDTDGCTADCHRTGGPSTTRPSSTTTTTTLPAPPCQTDPGLCDDRDPCSADSCTLDGCQHRPASGATATTCLLEDVGVHAASCPAPLPQQLSKRLDRARLAVADAVTTPSPPRRRAARRQLSKVLAAVTTSRRAGAIDRLCVNELVQLLDAVRVKVKGLKDLR